MQILQTTQTVKPTLLRKSFFYAGVAFVITTVIGIAISYWMKSVVNFNDTGSGRFNFDFINKANSAQEQLFKFMVAGGILAVFSMIITLVWMFRITKASKTFIFIAFGSSIISQGLGFGILFTSFQAMELLGIFGIGGGLFLSMALAGYLAKDLSSMRPFLFAGSIVVGILSLVSVIMFYAGVYNDTFYMLLIVGTGVLMLAWTMFDVWMIKRTSQYAEMNGGIDEMMEFRLVSYFSYKLFSDLISIIWTVARIYLRSRR